MSGYTIKFIGGFIIGAGFIAAFVILVLSLTGIIN